MKNSITSDLFHFLKGSLALTVMISSANCMNENNTSSELSAKNEKSNFKIEIVIGDMKDVLNNLKENDAETDESTAVFCPGQSYVFYQNRKIWEQLEKKREKGEKRKKSNLTIEEQDLYKELNEQKDVLEEKGDAFGGVEKVIHECAGEKFGEFLMKYMKKELELGGVYVTPAFNIGKSNNNNKIFVTDVPNARTFQTKNEEGISTYEWTNDDSQKKAENALETLYQRVVKECITGKVTTFFLPVVGTGLMHYPSAVAVPICINTFSKFFTNMATQGVVQPFEKVCIVVWDKDEHKITYLKNLIISCAQYFNKGVIYKTETDFKTLTKTDITKLENFEVDNTEEQPWQRKDDTKMEIKSKRSMKKANIASYVEDAVRISFSDLK